MEKLNPRMLDSEPMERCRLEECCGACCLYGVWVDKWMAEDIVRHADLIGAHLPAEQANPCDWFDGRHEPDAKMLSGEVVHTTVIPMAAHYGGTVCIFWRADAKCALQVAAEQSGAHKWRFKPFYCILHPLDLDEQGQITLDDTSLLLDEPASCVRPSRGIHPLKEIFAEELDYLLEKKKGRCR